LRSRNARAYGDGEVILEINDGDRDADACALITGDRT
jgi:hypothetical protein